jgi:O-acetyl-ADP-ribose deacetylase (regulator of RNase III)
VFLVNAPAVPDTNEEKDMADELVIGDTAVGIAEGDITAWKGDAVVNAANTSLVMGAGVAGAIAARAGGTVQREALEKAPVALGGAARTRAGLLPAKFVIHAAVMGEDRKTSPEIISRATAASLESADAVGLKRVAFPALGTGVGGIPYADAARAMFGAVTDYLKRRPETRLTHVTFVLYDAEAYGAFAEVLNSFQAVK